MKLSYYVALGAAGCALLASAAAFSAESDDRPGPGGPHHDCGAPPPPDFGPGVLRGVALTEAQQQKVFVIIDSKEAQRAGHMATLHDTHQALRSLAQSDRFDESRAAALAQAAGKATASLVLLEARADAHVHALLTPEQRADARNAGRHPLPPR